MYIIQLAISLTLIHPIMFRLLTTKFSGISHCTC